MRGSATTSAESWRTTRRPVALPPACTTRRTEWPPSRPSARRPELSASKRTPSACRSRTHSGASRDEDLGRRAAHEPAPGELGVAQVQLGAVVGRERRREASLRPVAGGLRQRRGGDEHDGGVLARGAQRGVQPGRARADDCDVGLTRDRQGGRGHRGNRISRAGAVAARRLVVPGRAACAALCAGLGGRGRGTVAVERAGRRRCRPGVGVPPRRPVVAPGVIRVVVPGGSSPGRCRGRRRGRRGQRSLARRGGCWRQARHRRGGGRGGRTASGELHERGGEDRQRERGDDGDRGDRRLPVGRRGQARARGGAAAQAPVLLGAERRAAERARFAAGDALRDREVGIADRRRRRGGPGSPPVGFVGAAATVTSRPPAGG